jgi:TonB family protein
MTITRRDPTVLVALVFALAAHLVVLAVGVRSARRDLGWWLKSQPVKLTPHPTGPVEIPKPNDPMQQLGDHDTNGTSINSSPGEVPMESMSADARQEQAMMQRDPAGFGGKATNQQLEKVLRGDSGDNRPRGQNSAGQNSPGQASAQQSQAAQSQAAQSSAASSVFGSRESSLADLMPKVSTPLPAKMRPDNAAKGTDTAIDPLSRGPIVLSPAKQNALKDPGQPNQAQDQQAKQQQTNQQQEHQQNEQQQQNQESPNQQANAAQSGGVGGKPGADPGAGNPAPTSDFESYPVTHVASRFVAGRIEARPGRKMRTRELPRLGVAAYADLEGMDNPSVVLMLRIDTSGNVTDVRIEHSSGSDDIDLPCQKAAYTWWFEPLKDPKTGQIRPEMIEFTIYF